MKEIQLTHGKVTVVDDDDFESLNQYKWYRASHGYVVRNRLKKEGGGSTKIYMHRQIARCVEDQIVDHISGDKLDNRRGNLRICTTAQNVRNCCVSKNNKLGVKGVSLSMGKYYMARVFHEGRVKFCKRFKTIEEAKSAYDFHAKLHHGEFSRS